MFSEPFAHGNSWVHALDARLRIGVAFIFSCVLAVATTWQQAKFGLIAACLLLICSRPPLRPLLRRLAAVNIFVLFLWLTVPCTMPGPAAFHLGSLSCSLAGLHLVWLITLKANAISLLFIACVATMPVAYFGHALHALRLPGKFVFLLLFTYRAIFLLADEWQRLNTALRLHNFVATSSLHSYRTLGTLVGLTLLRSIDRAGRIHQAMLLRGFSGHFTSLAEFRFTRRDGKFTVAALALLLLYFTLF
ncbi:MAG: energy-coupling factor transporter transmembrane protein EcfT [Desulfobulbaceae bacterium]|nr:energy-coupling factor transporter transmembrane protein EcfT [Desulfobulbaceae bacterium]